MSEIEPSCPCGISKLIVYVLEGGVLSIVTVADTLGSTVVTVPICKSTGGPVAPVRPVGISRFKEYIPVPPLVKVASAVPYDVPLGITPVIVPMFKVGAGPVAPVSPLGIVNCNVLIDAVPPLVTTASVPGLPVIVGCTIFTSPA